MALIGTLEVASDKSITHRAIIFSSLAKGETRIRNPLLGQDCLSTLNMFSQLGVEISNEARSIIIKSPGVMNFKQHNLTLDANNSGTTARLLMGVFSALPQTITLIGDESLSKRPMQRVVTPLSQMNANITLTNGKTLPAIIKGQTLEAIRYVLPVASAQVKSAIMLAALFAQGTTVIEEPVLTRDHTEKMFEAFKIDYTKENGQIKIKGQQTPITPQEIEVPGDISSAAFFLVAGLIIPNSHLTLKNVGLNESRSGIIDVIKKMNGHLVIENERYLGGEKVGDISVAYSPNLMPTVIEGCIIPRLIDEIPIIALLASFANGTTLIKDADELKVKETNRIDVTVNELLKLGISIESTKDGMIIYGNPNQCIEHASVSSHKDHRIAMMLCIASLRCEKQLDIKDIESMNISYPNFLADLKKLMK